ncbi:MAG: glycerate kinase, partial [Actinomycetota bacterium]|nr:glycerate kinase [Actinomycetota bacterium]
MGRFGSVRIVAAADKFRGTATATEATAAIADACRKLGHMATAVPLADGGEGTLEVLGGANQRSTITGPLGDPVECEWRMDGDVAVIESARACGLDLVGGGEHNDPVAASTFGVGELIDTALRRGAKHITVAVGGSATTDGGLGALSALGSPHRFRGIRVTVACDVRTPFTEAARVFGAQKGATPAQVGWLTGRLQQLAARYRQHHGVDVTELVGAGAAGGLAGGLAALGATLQPGFDVVSDELDLPDAIEHADLVITGEGRLDATSFDGKVVGGV